MGLSPSAAYQLSQRDIADELKCVSSFFLSSSSSTSVPTSVLGLLGGSLTDELRSFPFLVGLRRCHAKTPSSSSLNDCPPTEDLLGGCDFKHWLIVMNKPEGDPSRDELIESYIKTLAMVVGSELKEFISPCVSIIFLSSSLLLIVVRMKQGNNYTQCQLGSTMVLDAVYLKSTLSDKMKELPGVRWALPDSYMDVKNKTYGGEPFINGQAVPYDPKYHEELSKWTRSNPPDCERTVLNREGMPPDAAHFNHSDMGNNVPNAGDFNNMNTGGMPHRDAGPNAGYANGFPAAGYRDASKS
ncbi:hypothetical protein IFM89_034693 [Coptis chinensis]|uniref:MORF/ORRM1/DAG-like MORF domain-containing protein n=1 Tax=Coptis chinensis TaxID=261450 RepID=A0A835H6X5_9MAGN|nr:hypothetical protein IFM89_034693 [Coptis chinensis]